MFDEINAQLEVLSKLCDKPAGTIRITATDYAIDRLLWPKLSKVLSDYPDVKVELVTDYGLADIVAERFDAGVRLGDQIAHNMISVRIGPDICFAVIGARSYFEKHPPPVVPQDPLNHTCVNLRLPTHGGIYAWEFERDLQEMRVRVEGQLAFNNSYHVLQAAEAGFGLAYLPEELVEQQIADGRLVRVLQDWCPVWSGYPLYYPSCRQAYPAFAVMLNALRYREPDWA